MEIKKGDYVTRKSYENDTIFLVLNVKNDICYLKGVDVRLYADSQKNDLIKVNKPKENDDFIKKFKDEFLMDRNDYFYLPPKIVHVDGDPEYLNRCLKFYKEAGVLAIGRSIEEKNIAKELPELLNTFNPDVLIISGHDAYYRKKGDIHDINNYKNSANFVSAVNVARKYEKSHEKLVIIAGACQSNYEELIKAGANFASSPKRVNIHALDPAIIAVSLALTERNKEVDLVNLLEKTKYGKDGMGGLKCNGLMYVGYPR